MFGRVLATIGLVLGCGLVGAFSRAADAPTGATVTDSEGMEVKVSALKFGTGTHRLAWLADPLTAPPGTPKGPLAGTARTALDDLFKGIITYVRFRSVESIKYDYDKQVASVAVKE